MNRQSIKKRLQHILGVLYRHSIRIETVVWDLSVSVACTSLGVRCVAQAPCYVIPQSCLKPKSPSGPTGPVTV